MDNRNWCDKPAGIICGTLTIFAVLCIVAPHLLSWMIMYFDWIADVYPTVWKKDR